MPGKSIAVALAVVIAAATSAAFAQTAPNKGAARNHGGDSYGQPYSGTAGARRESGQ